MSQPLVSERICPHCGWQETRSSRTPLGQMADEQELDKLFAEHLNFHHTKGNHHG